MEVRVVGDGMWRTRRSHAIKVCRRTTVDRETGEREENIKTMLASVTSHFYLVLAATKQLR